VSFLVISLGKRIDRAHWALIAAVLVFLALGIWLSGGSPSWSEEISVLPTRAYPVFQASPSDPTLPERATSCDDVPAPGWVIQRTRPVFSTCAAGRVLPVMVTPYFSGIPYWPLALLEPLHHGDVFSIRRIGLALGVIGIVLAFELVRRIVDRTSAACTALVLSCSPPFVFSHSLALYYEPLPWHALTAAALALLGLREAAPARTRGWLLASSAFFVGLAVLANVKAMFLIAPPLVIALRVRRTLGVPGRTWLALALGAFAGAAPLLLFGLFDPHAGLEGQFAHRYGALLSNFGLRRFGGELYSLVLFASDTAAFSDQILKRNVSAFWPARIAVAAALVFCLHRTFEFLRYGRGQALAAALGATFLGYVLVSALLYTQYPSANYGPLGTAFGVALGCALGALFGRFGARWGVLATLVVMAMMFHNCVRRGDGRAELAWATNSAAERDMAAYLRERVGNVGTIASGTYNLTGVFTSLGGGDVRAAELLPFLAHHCSRENNRVDLGCLQRALGFVLDAPERVPPPLRMLVPAVVLPIDDAFAGVLEPALREAARVRLREVHVEHTSSTAAGTPVLRLLRVEPLEKPR
jgi:hypothetical protein